MNDPNLAGAEPADKKIWNSYVYWARSKFGEVPKTFLVSDPDLRLMAGEENSLHAIVFTVFALEYRLRSVYVLLGLPMKEDDSVTSLLNGLQKRTSRMERNGKQITFSREWKGVRKKLLNLAGLRNKIAHGDRRHVRELLSADLRVKAENGYNALIDAIRIINVAISYDTRTGAELTEYYSGLQVDTEQAGNGLARSTG